MPAAVVGECETSTRPSLIHICRRDRVTSGNSLANALSSRMPPNSRGIRAVSSFFLFMSAAVFPEM